jgi:hypothetical protein
MKPRMALRAVVAVFRECTSSRLGWLFACLHVAWFFLAIANMSPPPPALADFLDKGGSSTAAIFAGRPFHYHYESALLQVLVLADFPSKLVEALLGLVSFPLLMNVHLDHFLGSYLGAGLLLLIATFQWLVVGKSVQTWLSSKSWGAVILRTFTRYFAVTVAFVLLVAIVSVPLVNKRSQRRVFATRRFHCKRRISWMIFNC